MIRNMLIGVGILVLLILLTACGEKVVQPSQSLYVDITGLANLGNSARYEGWLVVNGTPKSLGKFTATNAGTISVTNFLANESDLEDATAFFVTVEKVPDNDHGPSANVIIAGKFVQATVSGTTRQAVLTMNDSLAIGNNLTGAAGYFVFRTPTDTNLLNETNGIWFMRNFSASDTLGLTRLPVLGSQWKYEAWLKTGDNYLSMGKFTSPYGNDDSSLYSGPLAPPPYPGEDFLHNLPSWLPDPVILGGSTLMVTVEPEPDNSPNPFFLRPLIFDIPNSYSIEENHALKNSYAPTTPNPLLVPSGRVYY